MLASRALYNLWWASLPAAVAGIVALLVATLRWVLAGGIRRFEADAFLPWLAVGLALALWLLLPTSYYLAGAPADDERWGRLRGAWRRAAQEFSEWLALPLELAYLAARWGVLLALAAIGAWLLLAGGDVGDEAQRRAATIAIRFALFLLLYLILTAVAALLAGLWAFLSHKGAADATPEEATASRQRIGEEV